MVDVAIRASPYRIRNFITRAPRWVVRPQGQSPPEETRPQTWMSSEARISRIVGSVSARRHPVERPLQSVATRVMQRGRFLSRVCVDSREVKASVEDLQRSILYSCRLLAHGGLKKLQVLALRLSESEVKFNSFIYFIRSLVKRTPSLMMCNGTTTPA
ncbi:hypothetical protein J6590_010593 [Homalodisca vitripennis]|nr:hypothetical protein J6590_010593 [Homalodisca vitripennis]